jgi:pullulanase
MCLVDKLKESKPADATNEELVRFDKLAQTVIFTSQGVPFLYAGEELYRNKKGIHNTYQSPDSVNRIDWNSKSVYKDIFDYYKGLIALRKNHSAFRMPTQEMIQQHLKFINLHTPNVVSFLLTDHVNDEIWKDILVIYNGNRKSVTIQIPAAEWNLICHNGKINLSGLAIINYTNFTVAPSSASILYTK